MKVRQPIAFHGADHRDFFKDVAEAINGRINFGIPAQNAQGGISKQNIDGHWATAVSDATPDTEFAVTHNLNRVPVGFDIKRMDAACIVYDSGTPWTATQIFVKCNVALVNLTFFIH